METENKVPDVYKRIAEVQQKLSETGIAKDGHGDGIKYRFRGIDQVYAVLSPMLVEAGLLILPRTKSHSSMEQTTTNGKKMIHATVEMEYDIVSPEDGSKHTVSMYGSGADSGDKAYSKSLSMAYKYMVFETFCVPVEGEPDADTENHEFGKSSSKEDDYIRNVINQFYGLHVNTQQLIAYLKHPLNRLSVAEIEDLREKREKLRAGAPVSDFFDMTPDLDISKWNKL